VAAEALENLQAQVSGRPVRLTVLKIRSKRERHIKAVGGAIVLDRRVWGGLPLVGTSDQRL
jgi:hypothetical protein